MNFVGNWEVKMKPLVWANRKPLGDKAGKVLVDRRIAKYKAKGRYGFTN